MSVRTVFCDACCRQADFRAMRRRPPCGHQLCEKCHEKAERKGRCPACPPPEKATPPRQEPWWRRIFKR